MSNSEFICRKEVFEIIDLNNNNNSFKFSYGFLQNDIPSYQFCERPYVEIIQYWRADNKHLSSFYLPDSVFNTLIHHESDETIKTATQEYFDRQNPQSLSIGLLYARNRWYGHTRLNQ
jgi:hypothetical protein